LAEGPPNSAPPPGGEPLWGSYGAGGSTPTRSSQPSQPSPLAAKAFGDEPLEPLSRRLLQLAGLLSVLLLAVLANSFLNSGTGSSGSPLELNPVAAATEQAEENSGGRISIFFVYSSPAFPQPVNASGGGVYNEETERSRITVELENPLTGESMDMVQIEDGDTQYEGGELLADSLPPGKQWVRTDKSDGPDEDDTPLGIEESMQMLGSSEEVQLVGRESINGKMSRRYRGEISIGELVDMLRKQGKDAEAEAYEEIEGESPTQISAEAWIDRKNVLRRLRIVMPMPSDLGEAPVTMDLRMDFFAYGAEPDIEIPDPDTVVDGPLDDEEDAPSSASIS
jgi:hypothetical protein